MGVRIGQTNCSRRRCESIRKTSTPVRAMRTSWAGWRGGSQQREGWTVKRGSLHWFWRGAIALLVACCYGGLSVSVLETIHESIADDIRHILNKTLSCLGVNQFRSPGRAANGFVVPIAWFAPAVLLALATYGLLTWRFGGQPRDAETRCRKCGYILRGIAEPRCSECGESI